MAFARFMNSTLGRWVRIVGGVALIGAGLLLVGGVLGIVIAGLGLIPLAAGVFDFCLLAPILSVPWSGKTIRSMSRS